jgi:dUTP pyrophosphatase
MESFEYLATLGYILSFILIVYTLRLLFDLRPNHHSPSTVTITRLCKDAILPSKGTAHSAGLDMYSTDDRLIAPRETCIIETGIRIHLPPDSYAQLQSRSGLALKGIFVEGGVIDVDYTGTIKVIITNSSQDSFQIRKGHRIAQLIIHRIHICEVVEGNNSIDNYLSRGTAGFGSTGI